MIQFENSDQKSRVFTENHEFLQKNARNIKKKRHISATNFPKKDLLTSPTISPAHEGCNISDQIKLTNCQWPTIDFVRAFLLSLESQTTIGYGGRYSRNHCRYPMVLQTLQFLINVLLMAYMLTITSTRFTRSRSECENLIRYSKNVVICHHEDHKGVKERCLKFRMTNNSCSDEAHAFKLLFQKDKTITYNELVGVSITAKVLVTRSSTLCGNLKSRKHWRSGNEHEQESEIIPLQEFEVKLENWQTVFGTTGWFIWNGWLKMSIIGRKLFFGLKT